MVRDLDREPVPPDFEDGVSPKTKKRSKGAYKRLKQGLPYYFRAPFELFSILMIVVLVAIILLQHLAGKIRPAADNGVKVEKTGGAGEGLSNPRNRYKRMQKVIKREVVSYRFLLLPGQEKAVKSIVELAVALGGKVKARKGDGMTLTLPKESFKRFANELTKGVRFKVERIRTYTDSPQKNVEVDISFFE